MMRGGRIVRRLSMHFLLFRVEANDRGRLFLISRFAGQSASIDGLKVELAG